MLSPSVHLRLFGLVAGASLVAAAVAWVRTGGAPPEPPVVASRPAPPAPAVPAPEPAEAARETAPAPLAAAPPPPAREPPTGSVAPAAAPRAAPEAPRAAPEAPRAAAEAPPAEVPRSARAELVGRGSGRLDLNTASVAELNALRGAGRIGRRIVKHRPYRTPDDLLRKRVLSRSAYAKIKDQVRVGGEGDR